LKAAGILHSDCRRRASVTPDFPAAPRRRRRPLPALAQGVTIQRRNRAARFPEGRPGCVGRTRDRRLLGRHIQRSTAARLAIGDVEMGAVPKRDIVRARAGRLPTSPRSFRQSALDHRARGTEERTNQGPFGLTHITLRQIIGHRFAVKNNLREKIRSCCRRKVLDRAECPLAGPTRSSTWSPIFAPESGWDAGDGQVESVLRAFHRYSPNLIVWYQVLSG
jgi:hypothetical protein